LTNILRACLKSNRAKRFFHIFGRFLACALLMFCLLWIYFPYNSTPSMPIGIYFRLPPWNLKVGDIVQVDNPEPGYLGINAPSFIKRIASVDEQGCYEVLGDSQRSYDSRYFGNVKRSSIKAILIPVFINRNSVL